MVKLPAASTSREEVMKIQFGRKVGVASAAIALLLGAGLASAQDTGVATAPPPPGEGQIAVRTMGPLGGGIGFMGFEAGIAGKTVAGAPFSATVSTHITRTLADGNKIDQTITGTIARDSEGRTRRDMTLPGAVIAGAAGGGTPHAVFINDPVSGTSYILHPEERVADQVPLRAVRGIRRVVRKDFGITRRVDSEPTRTDLGAQTINGVMAQGTRITRTIPAGQIGNEKPIVIVTERWYSPDLQMYVVTKTNDPLMGDTVYQLTNIQRQEPDPSLFQVPSDYTVKQRPRPMTRFRGRNGAGGPLAPRDQP
jgi:hypothetical protein